VFLTLSLLAAAACSQGTSAWLLRESAQAGGAGGTLGGSGEAGASGEAGGGAAGDANEAGAGGQVPAGPRCPTRFAAQCSPKLSLQNLDTGENGQLFPDAIPDPVTTVDCITRDVCNVLFRRASEIRPRDTLHLILEDYDGVSETWSTGTDSTIHMSTRHLRAIADAKGSVEDEIRGILYYHGTNIYQSDDGNGAALLWVVQGVGQYVRHSAGYVSDSARKAGGAYSDGGNTTGFFFIWIDGQYPDFIYALNQSLSPTDNVTWTTQAFTDITGQSVDKLWASYQKTF